MSKQAECWAVLCGAVEVDDDEFHISKHRAERWSASAGFSKSRSMRHQMVNNGTLLIGRSSPVNDASRPPQLRLRNATESLNNTSFHVYLQQL